MQKTHNNKNTKPCKQKHRNTTKLGKMLKENYRKKEADEELHRCGIEESKN